MAPDPVGEALDAIDRGMKQLRVALAAMGATQPVTPGRYLDKQQRVDLVLNVTAARYHVKVPSILGVSRAPSHVEARHAAIIVLHDHLGLSLSEIGRLFRRDHSTVRHAVVKLRKEQPQPVTFLVAEVLEALSIAQNEQG